MKKLFFISLLFIILYSKTVFAYDTAQIAREIQTFFPEIKADSGDIEKILNDVFDYDPRLLMYYKGYNGSYNSRSSTIKIIYNNQDVLLRDIYVARNKEEFINLITRALLYGEDKIYIVGENMPASKTPINEYFSEVGKNCPIAYMGYRGNNIYTLDCKIANYSCYTINFEYDFDKATLTEMKKELEQKACEIVASNIAKDMPPYMKVFAIHNYIINNCKYAEDYDTNSDPVYYTAYGTLVKGEAVCDGYASAASLLFNMCGIENIKIAGESKGVGHAWNLIKLDDEYYHIDTTWDDPVSHNGLNYLKYDYYNLNDEQISTDHTWEKSDYPQAIGSLYTYSKTVELIRNDSNSYTEGYTSFESVFSKYPALTGSINPSTEETTEITSLESIEPESVLDNADNSINTYNLNFVDIIMGLFKSVIMLRKVIIVVIVIWIIRRVTKKRE